MKKFLLLLLLIPLASCNKDKKGGLSGNAFKVDSMQVLLNQKDSVINDVFVSMSVISENLESIKLREGVINRDMQQQEMTPEVRVRISRDIEVINELLMENREAMEKMKGTSAALAKANAKIVGLERMISQYALQVDNKDQEILILQNSLESMRIEVKSLTGQVHGLTDKVEELDKDRTTLQGEVKDKIDIINTAYYIIGEEKVLIEKNILYKKGFIGRTLKINENRSLDSFTRVDTRDFDELIIGGKKATLVSMHPADSYEFVANSKGVYDIIKIIDLVKFWEYSKVLVVSYK